jgi:ketosteroid isomerase-like protein
MKTPREVSESYWAAECRGDVEGILAHYHPDATYEDGGGLRRGHAAIRRAYEEAAREYPQLEVEIVREYVADQHSSAFEFDAVLIDRSERRFRVRGVNVVVVRDGRFVSVRSYEDVPSLEPLASAGRS